MLNLIEINFLHTLFYILEESEKLHYDRTGLLMTDLTSFWPNQLVCAICNMPFNGTSKTRSQETSREICQRCRRPFHVSCFDHAGSNCGFCRSVMLWKPDGSCDDQPPNGRMEVRTVDDPKATPAGFSDAKGHILITYIFQCGLQLVSNCLVSRCNHFKIDFWFLG